MNRNLINSLKFTQYLKTSRSCFKSNSNVNCGNVFLNNFRYLYTNYINYPYNCHIIKNNYRYCQTTTSLKDSIESAEEAIKQFRVEHQIFVKNASDEKNIFDFNELNIKEQLWKIMKNLNYNKPTPIQAQALPILFSGHDLIGMEKKFVSNFFC